MAPNEIINSEKNHQSVLNPTGEMLLDDRTFTEFQSAMPWNHFSTKCGNNAMRKQNSIIHLLMLKHSIWIQPLSFGDNFQFTQKQETEEYVK